MKTKLIAIISTIVIAAGIAAFAVIGSSVKANENISEESTSDTPLEVEIEIPVGKYYRGGDTSSEYYIHIMEDHKVQIVCPDLHELICDWAKTLFDDTERIESTVETNYEIYGGVKYYNAVDFPEWDQTVVFVHSGLHPDGETMRVGFDYPRDNVIIFLDEEYIYIE